MPQGPFKKVDGLFRREKAPLPEQERAADLGLEREIKPEISEEIEKTRPIEQVKEPLPTQTLSPSEPLQPIVKTPARQQVEDILAEDLETIYSELPQPLQSEFKIKGEETATKITLLLQKAKVKIKEIINLIKKWLKTIPGINKFFLEQEAKIKADKIMDLQRPKEK